jgi:hypothetical protein
LIADQKVEGRACNPDRCDRVHAVTDAHHDAQVAAASYVDPAPIMRLLSRHAGRMIDRPRLWKDLRE